MNIERPICRLIVVGLFVSLPGTAGFGRSTQSQSVSPGDSSARLATILQKSAERVQRYTTDILSFVCTEVTRQQELGPDLKTPTKKATDLVYDFIIVRPPEPGSAIRERRELKSIDGKTPGKKTSPPVPDGSAYTTALVVLLPENQVNSQFSYVGTDELDGRAAFIIEYVPAKREPPRATWSQQFFQFRFQTKGRIWVDAESYDVLRLDTHLIEPVEFQSPRTVRKGPFLLFGPSRKFKIETWDITIRFRSTTFHEPEQVLPLPVSSESVRVIEGSRIPRLRITHAFTNYKRFTSETKIQPQ